MQDGSAQAQACSTNGSARNSGKERTSFKGRCHAMDDMHKEGRVPSVCDVVVGKGSRWDAVMLSVFGH